MFSPPLAAVARLLRGAYHFGVDRVPPVERRRVQTGNLLALIGAVVTTGYALGYLLILGSGIGFALTEACALAYLSNFALVGRGAVHLARVTICTVFLVNLTVSLVVLFTPETGFALYYILVGPLAFLLFDSRYRVYRLGVTLASGALYALVQVVPSLQLGGPVSPAFNAVTYQSSVPGVMLVILVVVSLFVKELEDRVVELDRAATTDSLTGLLNRASVFERAAWALERAEQAGRPVSVLMMDVDHFKRVNDEHGHATGDAALTQLAILARASLRLEDLVGRIGGEEFLVVCPGVDAEGAVAAAERLRLGMAAHTIEAADGTRLQLTGSFGVAQHIEGEALSALVSRADHALYRAKSAGRNRTVVDPPARSILAARGA